MPYVAKERIHVNSQNQPCDADDPDVSVMVAAPWATLHLHEVERYGLKGDRRLQKISPDAEEAPERGAGYYELTGQEPPVTKHASRVLGQAVPPERGADEPERTGQEPASSAQEQDEPARSRRGR